MLPFIVRASSEPAVMLSEVTLPLVVSEGGAVGCDGLGDAAVHGVGGGISR